MPAQDKSDLFEFMLERVKETQKQHLDGEQAIRVSRRSSLKSDPTLNLAQVRQFLTPIIQPGRARVRMIRNILGPSREPRLLRNTVMPVPA